MVWKTIVLPLHHIRKCRLLWQGNRKTHADLAETAPYSPLVDTVGFEPTYQVFREEKLI